VPHMRLMGGVASWLGSSRGLLNAIPALDARWSAALFTP
jgi:hypothetical protein